MNEAEAKERIMQLKMTRNPEHAVLTGHVGKTFESPHTESAISNAVTTKDIFHVNTRSTKPPPTQRPGQWNPDDPMYNMDRWVYDTPGAVNSNQVQFLHQLLLCFLHQGHCDSVVEILYVFCM